MLDSIHPRRLALGAVKRLLMPSEEPSPSGAPAPVPPSENSTMSRPRDRILGNLDDMYREAFAAAKGAEDDAQMRSLDFAYRREQLYFEILLDIRDAMLARR